MNKDIAVIGAGNGGYAYTFYLTKEGHRVNLFEFPEFKSNIDQISERGGIEAYGEVSGFIKPNMLTTDIKEALEGVEIIIIPVPAFAHDFLFKKMVPHLKKGQTVLLCPDNLGTIKLYEALKKHNKEQEINIAGTASLLFVAKKDENSLGPARINIDGVKKEIRIASMPANNNDIIKKIFNDILSNLNIANNVLENSLSNINHQIHPSPMILNAGRIESPLDFKFYYEGHTASIDRVVQQVDKEKLLATRALGLEVEPLDKLFSAYYNGCSIKNDTTHQKISTNICYRNVIAPDSLKTRFVTEDINNGLVLLSSIGKHFNLKTPVIDAIINIASALNGENYWEQGITLDKLGFGEMSKEEIHSYLSSG